MRWDDLPQHDSGVRFAAPPEKVEGYGGRGVNAIALHPSGGYVFLDTGGAGWWVVFQPDAGPGLHWRQRPGDILACSAAFDEMVHVVVLASHVRGADALAAFHSAMPATLEEAVDVAAALTTPTKLE
ncbi:hypothetical protein SAMN04489743_3444 [Pseudarthrobacter equi]|uniref:Uncharacterized protein n=1 Tax=Pseudarthrobacter equi TaxID=728066 RepID=A0A1H2B5L3_9MICC|nr:hypothetical protein [Pseudarthrobacter equi]SDT53474.1 hypothetical protein SAMN04489743_3444 [Pseudarthrobacter equi]